MSRHGKSARKKKSIKSIKSDKINTTTVEPEPIFQPLKYTEHMISESKRSGKKAPISKADMEKMGFETSDIKMMEDMKAIKSLSPYMTVARICKNMKFSKGGEKETSQTLSKGEVYVMALGMYDSLRFSPQSRREVMKPYKHTFANVFNRYDGHDLTDKTILIWRTGGIGDLLFIKPNMDEMKKRWPSCKIWFACAPSYQHMVKHWSCVDKLVDLPINYYTVFTKADYHVTFEGAIERNLDAHKRNAYELFSEWMGLNLKGEDLIPFQVPPEPLVGPVDQILKTWGIDPTAKDFILLQLQPSSPIRGIADDKWIEVIDELTSRGHKVIITDSPHKNAYVEALKSRCTQSDMVYNFSQFSETLDYTIALCARAKCSLGPDSSLNHIAGSLGIPCFGIFGPFTGEIRLSEFPQADWINCERECAPCFLHGNELCKVAKELNSNCSPCLENFEAIEVVDRIEKLIN